MDLNLTLQESTQELIINFKRLNINLFLKLIIVFSFLVLTNCTINNDAFELQESEKLLWIDSKKVNCTGIATQKCYLIQDGGKDKTSNWEYFYDGITGFDSIYEEGFSYKIMVLRKTIKNPAQDQGAFKYELVKVISKNE